MASPNSSDLLLVNRDGVDYVTTYGEVFPTVDDLPLIPGPPVIALNGQPQTAPAEPGDPIVIIRNGDGPGSPTNQWQRGSESVWTNIAGATGESYTVTNDDLASNIRLEQTFSDGSELYSNEIVVTAPIPMPWEGHDGGIWHIKNVQNGPLALTGSPFTAWDIDGTNERSITSVAVGQELVFVTPKDANNLFNNSNSLWEFGEHTDVSLVNNLAGAFEKCRNFNGEINHLDVANVNNMGRMFMQAGSFNKNLSKWDTSNVTNMANMFYITGTFNQDISDWNVSNVTNMYQMFAFALAFNQDLSDWCVSNISSKPYDFDFESGFWNQKDRQPCWGHCPRGENGTVDPCP